MFLILHPAISVAIGVPHLVKQLLRSLLFLPNPGIETDCLPATDTMGLRDMLKKKEPPPQQPTHLGAPVPTFVRSDTFTQEVIHPPPDPHAPVEASALSPTSGSRFFSRSRGSSVSSTGGNGSSASAQGMASPGSEKGQPTEKKRLSQRLHLSRAPASSDFVPQDLPDIVHEGPDEGDKEGNEARWEDRATRLARHERSKSQTRIDPVSSPDNRRPGRPRSHSAVRYDGKAEGGVGSAATDADIQTAIRLHEEGDLEESTRLFGILADSNGLNNPLSQVLYALALRHGWGCQANPQLAMEYLGKAAANAGAVEEEALKSGMRKGGAAKGELVMAIHEMGVSFKEGWGVKKDPIAAKQYFETAANLGDTEAMNDIAWCYLEGFGCKKDKFLAAKYYRLAEQGGNKTIGNTWIWKEKYNPENQKKK